MNRSTGARIGATAAVSALSLALLTGCGGDSESTDSKGTDKSTDAATTAAAKAFSAAELEKLIIATGDVKGYEATPSTDSDKFADSKDAVTVADAKCAPIAYVLTGFAPGDESAYVNRQVLPAAETTTESPDSLEDALGATMTIVSLSSYEGEAAAETMKSFTDAVSGCTGGFTVSAKGEDTQKFTKVAAEKGSGTGDESVAFGVTAEAEGEAVLVHGEAVRHGSTVATYYSISLAAFSGETKAYTIPAEIIEGQAAKLK